MAQNWWDIHLPLLGSGCNVLFKWHVSAYSSVLKLSLFQMGDREMMIAVEQQNILLQFSLYAYAIGCLSAHNVSRLHVGAPSTGRMSRRRRFDEKHIRGGENARQWINKRKFSFTINRSSCSSFGASWQPISGLTALQLLILHTDNAEISMSSFFVCGLWLSRVRNFLSVCPVFKSSKNGSLFFFATDQRLFIIIITIYRLAATNLTMSNGA